MSRYHHLEQRRPGDVALLGQAGEHGLEGHVLVRIRSQGDLPHLLHQARLGGEPSELQAPHQLELIRPAGLGTLGVGGVQHEHLEPQALIAHQPSSLTRAYGRTAPVRPA